MDDSQPLIDQSQTADPRWTILRRKVLEHNAWRAFNILDSAGIPCIVIKGVAAGAYYPDNVLRDSVDTDIAVDREHFREAVRIATSNAGLGLAIDLHAELQNSTGASWSDLVSRSQYLELTAGRIAVLCPEHHLRLLCHHWLIDGGRDHRRLLDLKYLIEGTKGEFDWDIFENGLSARQKLNFGIAIGIASVEFDLDLDKTPYANIQKQIPQWIWDHLRTEWQRDFRHLPIESSVLVKGETFAQMRDRFSPSPIRAIIEMRGSLDTKWIGLYKASNFFLRIPSTLRRVASVFYYEWRNKNAN